MKYEDIKIWSIDKEFIDEISYKYDIDYWDAEIYIDHWDITNQIIEYIFFEAINNLDISDDNKDYLMSKTYCNCTDSWINLYPDDVDDDMDWDDEEKQIIKDFLNL